MEGRFHLPDSRGRGKVFILMQFVAEKKAYNGVKVATGIIKSNIWDATIDAIYGPEFLFVCTHPCERYAALVLEVEWKDRFKLGSNNTR